ncbi:NAD-binding protein [Schizopora paradoxa]|uniref:NAD-binding protein n=1 Tax=Schizopora paradoxa TaxID=27342 RepID=A0A0H2RUF1_9AGAM|nr:NAD-binding protein [Schizopora paradoxa]
MVTGAAQGIGRAVALRLAKDGYSVALNDLPSAQTNLECLQEEIGSLTGSTGVEASQRDTLLVMGDVSVEEEVQGMVSSCVEKLGGLDVMVANAGIAIVKPLVELSAEEFDKVISVNLRGVMLCYKYAAIQMIKQGGGGRIIGASSANGKVGAPRLTAYSASKFAIRGLTQSAALELGKHKITVNAYAPARILTPMLEEYDDTVVSNTPGMVKGDFLEQLRKSTAVGHLAGPGEVASLIAYLVSEEAHFITGQTVNVNGGTIFD